MLSRKKQPITLLNSESIHLTLTIRNDNNPN